MLGNPKNLKIGARLGAGFALLILAGAAVSVLGWLQLKDVKADVHELMTDGLTTVDNVREVKDNLNSMVAATRLAVLQGEASAAEGTRQRVGTLKANNNVLLNKVATAMHAKESRAKIEAFRDSVTPLYESIASTLDAAESRDSASALGLIVSGQLDREQAAFKMLDEVIEMERAEMRELVEHVEDSATSSAYLMVVAAAISALLGSAVAVWLTRSITKPLRDAVEAAERVAAGDLTVSIETDLKDETGQLLLALAKMRGELSRLVASVRLNCESIATASSEIAVGSSDLSRRTEAQASSLQQTAASVEEINATVRNSAETAQEAATLARKASVAAQDGGQVVTTVLRQMEGISAGSRRIAEIIGVIDAIAFQTNILALNAAVEAARAGDQGRGFAVVASEVRTLAQRSASAAREIKQLIQSSVAEVEHGAALAGSAGEAMRDIVDQVLKVSKLITEISEGAEEQAVGIGQVSQAVSHLDSVTQQNAALVEQSAAAADSLRQQSTVLVRAVGAFKLSP